MSLYVKPRSLQQQERAAAKATKPAPMQPQALAKQQSGDTLPLITSSSMLTATVSPNRAGGAHTATVNSQAAALMDWSRVTFADIPRDCYEHVLRETLKGMLWVDVCSQNQQIQQIQQQQQQQQQQDQLPSARHGGKSRGKGVSWQEDTTLDEHLALPGADDTFGSNPFRSAPGTAGQMQQPLPTRRSMYNRMLECFNDIIATYVISPQEREQQLQREQEGLDANGVSANGGVTVPAAQAMDGSFRKGTASTASGAPIGALTFSTTAEGQQVANALGLGTGHGKGDHWITRQAERRMLQLDKIITDLREENDHLREQLTDLDSAHTHVQSELTRAYKEYDALQRRLIAVTEQQQKEKEQHQQRQKTSCSTSGLGSSNGVSRQMTQESSSAPGAPKPPSQPRKVPQAPAPSTPAASPSSGLVGASQPDVVSPL